MDKLTPTQQQVFHLIAAHDGDPIPVIDFSPGTPNHEAADDLESFGLVYRARYGYALTVEGREVAKIKRQH